MKIITLKVINNFFKLAMFIHISGCCWLFVNKIEGEKSYYIRKGIQD